MNIQERSAMKYFAQAKPFVQLTRFSVENEARYLRRGISSNKAWN